MSGTHLNDTANLIDGELVAGGGAAADPARDPSTGTVLAEVPRSSPADVDRAVAAARRAFPGWRALTPADRAARLNALADALQSHAKAFAEAESANAGKPIAAVPEEIDYCADNIRFLAGAARSLQAPAAGEYVEGATSFVRREPVGVVAAIAPWNYPLMMAVWKFAPALAVGCTVVLKPSELTPLSTLALAALAAELLPPGVLNVVTGDGPVGAQLAAHPDVAMISLTGSVATGRKVAAAAAPGLKRLHLELGGKAPVVVLDDADVEALAASLRIASFGNAGQDCTAACRVIATPAVYGRVVEALTEVADSLRTGPTDDPATELGPLISTAQRDRVAGFVGRAVAAGASVTAGGAAPDGPGAYYPATVVIGPDQDAEIVQREVFGPVVTVQRAADPEQALAMASDVPYGLSASVWTADAGRALRAAAGLRFGAVWVNDHLTGCSEMPHGGFGQSGYGRDLSGYALDHYSEPRHVMVRW
ncbi:aminobutyraldehyde dehydrogenase [Streptomyces sp. NPDC051940]|uniref:aminobutyraldehyde dehydrogenase n=1 Tax=Streptomyces sp. NPDC051940 TaxID=3155675 RepID=UPI0034395950